MMRPIIAVFSLLPITALSATVPTWCGKPYQSTSPHITIPAASKFSVPATSSTPLLNFQCNPAIKPYLSPSDITAAVIVDAEVTNDIGTKYDATASGTAFTLTVSIGGVGTVISAANASVGASAVPFKFSLSGVAPSTTAYTVTCTAKFAGGATYTSTTKLAYLPPNPYGGNTVKMDMATGGLLVKGPSDTAYKPFFPFGFYTQYGTYVQGNFSKLDDAAKAG